MGLVATLLGASPSLAAQASSSPSPPQIEVSGATLVEFDDATGVWVLRGQPVVITREPIVVRAEVVRYDSKQQLVSASNTVAYRDGVVEVFANTVAVWIVKRQAVAEGDVTAVYHGPDQVRLAAARVELSGRPGEAKALGKAVLTHRRGTLTADEITYDEATNQAVAEGAATAESEDGTLRADRVEASLARQEIVAGRHVLVTGRDLEGSAERAVLNQQTGTVDLSGEATVRLASHMFRASRIIVDVRTRRVTASGGVHVVAQP